MNGLAFYERMFGKGPRQRNGSLDRCSLPPVSQYLRQHGLISRDPKKASYATIRCPSHKGGEEQRPSMVVDLSDGHYCCFTCKAKGGDIVSLHRLITGLGFREAVADLGGRFHE